MPRGEKIWEEKSRSVGRRIKDISEKGILMEADFVGQIQGFGRLEGEEIKVIGSDEYLEKPTGDVVTGRAQGVMTFPDGDIVPFKAMGVGKQVRRSPLGLEMLLALIYFVDPPASRAWMGTTCVLWEAVTDPETKTLEATAWEWEAPTRMT